MAAPRNYSIFDIYEFISTDQSAVNFLQARNVIRSNEHCPRCGQLLRISQYNSNKNVGYILLCPGRNCRARKSIIVHTFFENLHFPLRKYIALIYYWSSQTPISTAIEHLQISKPTLIDHYNFIRDICSWKLLQEPIQLGGPDIIVQIDESVFIKAKYNIGHALQRPQRWVFGIYDTVLKRGYLCFVVRRDADTLLPIIQRVVKPGSIIHSDQWAAYNSILELPHPQPYRHLTVNHSRNFVDPQTGVHTNNVEALWSRCKKRFKQMNGTADDLVSSYIDEFMWRQFYGSTSSEAFDNILQHISERYPV